MTRNDGKETEDVYFRRHEEFPSGIEKLILLKQTELEAHKAHHSERRSQQ